MSKYFWTPSSNTVRCATDMLSQLCEFVWRELKRAAPCTTWFCLMDLNLLNEAMQATAVALIDWCLDVMFPDVEPPSSSIPNDDGWTECVHMVIVTNNSETATCSVCGANIQMDADAYGCGACAQMLMHASCWVLPIHCTACGVLCVQ